MQKMKETMISKNVASEIAEKLCDSVAQKLQGKVVGTFSTINATVRQSLTEACVQVRGGAVEDASSKLPIFIFQIHLVCLSSFELSPP